MQQTTQQFMSHEQLQKTLGLQHFKPKTVTACSAYYSQDF